MKSDLIRRFGQRPHDAYFEQVFKQQVAVLELLDNFMPAEQLADLDLGTLRLSSESFVQDDAKENLSDLVYACQTKSDKPVRVCLLFEHKSYATGRKIFVQMSNYLRGIQEEDIRQNRAFFTLAIPILFYHGEAKWEVGALAEQYGDVPQSLGRYVPRLELLKIDLQSMSDGAIRKMEATLVLRNVFLAFKHARDKKYVREHFSEMLIFVGGKLPIETMLSLFEATLFYLQVATELKKQEVMELVQSLPLEYEKRAKSALEEIFEEGMEKGMEKGMANLLAAFLKKNPTWPDQQIADYFGIGVSFVKKVRQSMA